MTNGVQKLIQSLKLVARYGLIVLNDGLICLPIKRRLIIFESFNGKDVNDNPAAIYRQLVADHPEYQATAYFSVKPREYHKLHQQYPDIQLIKRFTPRWVGLMARAEYWVLNSRLPNWWHKNRRTQTIQTWHGTPLKKLGTDIEHVAIPGTSTQAYHDEFIKAAHQWDYLIAPNQYSRDIFKRAFGFNGKFLTIGYPRNDVLYHDNQSVKLRALKQKLLGTTTGTVVTYAPTWRDDMAVRPGVYRFDLPFDLAAFFDHVPAGTRLIIRPHYLVKDAVDIRGFEDRVSVLADADIAELYLISDLLITDYSSVMFDFANLKRPELFFAYDLEHYRDQLRGFYFDYERELPGPLVTTARALYRQLDEWSQEGQFPTFAEQQTAFYHKFCAWEDGTASRQVVKIMVQGKED
ncbi:glycosyl glycerophosphate transferase [Levilactobacillus senmaizukei DSM 21775 = NBRC 103853]|uniref:Glycosyl glycerophosphate transferase n=1 Tax=Levilactobacillus senmaizukei DSM 21775 = NBRC 103853 TaxID=1423803 RepID=A0A0R2DG71_9LACO|nr:CDP-glycerol glycerophosphotransferase family protein [Levilactobacillus senmaizukei]KRN02598.1 glycosyl glycerophosphate transferase [Levilactobacillus senmaizukei DSM 21775 = NBRC 103853]